MKQKLTKYQLKRIRQKAGREGGLKMTVAKREAIMRNLEKARKATEAAQ